jgi:5-formyltetrahydrofolate cyclo-ligase
MEFREWRPGIRMVPGIWQIPVPAEGPPVAPDLIWVPLLGFDSAGYRLGYGGGYYDRTLGRASPRPFAIGIGYELVRLASIVPQPHDVAMDAIVTEEGVVFERPTSTTG